MTMSEAITSGTWKGLTLGFHDATGRLPDEARSFLQRPDLTPRSAQEAGVAEALLELGFVRRTFWTRRLVAVTGEASGRRTEVALRRTRIAHS